MQYITLLKYRNQAQHAKSIGPTLWINEVWFKLSPFLTNCELKHTLMINQYFKHNILHYKNLRTLRKAEWGLEP